MNKNEIIELYKEAIDDAQSMWLSEYCCTKEEEDNRIKEDKESIEHFIALLNEESNE